MASLLVESDEKRRKTSEEEDGIRTLKELPDALLVFVMDFLRGGFKCWASLLGTCKYVHNHHVDNLVELKILWEKAQRKRALYNCYFYSTINLRWKEIGAEGAKYVAEALKVNTSLTKINLSYNNIGDEGKQALREVWNHNDGLIL
jgi:hypothetical protein